jgi:hypothetical protein
VNAGAALDMVRAQVERKGAGLDASAAENPGALTIEACAMYRQALDVARQMNVLAAKIIRAEHSHSRCDLQGAAEGVRAQAAAIVEKVYRVASDSPPSIFVHVREASAELRMEAAVMLFPQ